MENEPRREEEQNREEILRILTEAIEMGSKVYMTQLKSDGQPKQGIAEPISIDGDILEIDADGYGLSIDVNSIKDVRHTIRLPDIGLN